MTDERNMALSDDLMEQVAGGITQEDPVGFICEATVLSGPADTQAGRTTYRVEADNGRQYTAYWQYPSVLGSGARTQLIHDTDGTYYLEPLVM